MTARSLETAHWLASSPALLAGIGLWLGGSLLLELVWYRWTRTPYRGAEVRRSVGAFAVVGTAQILVSLALVPVLWWVWPYRLTTLSMDSIGHWALAWVVVDFIYYWIHRLLHVTRIGWCLHSPHHSMPQVSNLDSLRISWGEQPVGVLAYGIPLVLLGVPPHIAGIFYAFIALYQFAVHTEMSWSLGPLDGIVYTPAAHRVHHSTVREEADRNYGGFFLLFDRLFGTHIPTRRTDRPVAYGLPADRQPGSLREVLFGEVRTMIRGLGEIEGLGPKLRYVLVRS